MRNIIAAALLMGLAAAPIVMFSLMWVTDSVKVFEANVLIRGAELAFVTLAFFFGLERFMAALKAKESREPR